MFRLIIKNEKRNKMSAANIAIVFAPTLFRKKNQKETELLSDQTDTRAIIELMILNYDQILVVLFVLSFKQIPICSCLETQRTRKREKFSQKFKEWCKV